MEKQSWHFHAKATQSQKQEILNLWSKLKFTEEDYGLKLDEVYWHQALAIISGAEWMVEHPKAWILQNNEKN